MEREEVPEFMWSIICPERGKLQVQKVPTPKPGPGEVLVKVMAAPINPSDLYFMKGMYQDFDLFKYEYPTSSGWEGAGIVVATGGGMMTWNCLGRRVSFVRKVTPPNEFKTGGCHAQYCIADAATLNMLNNDMPLEIASLSFVNPLTALGLLDKIKKLKAKAAIQTGAASQLGRMLIKLCQRDKIPLINIVRREVQVKMLKEEYGCENVLNSSDADFYEQFKNLAKELKATACIECISGETTGRLMECLPSRSTVVFYGALSEKGASAIDPLLMIGRNYKLEGFVLGQFLQSKGIWIINVIKEMNALMADKTLQSKIQKQFGLADLETSVADYYANMTAGKFVLCPHQDIEALKDDTEFKPFSFDHLGTE